jgi:hypothetical protein
MYVKKVKQSHNTPIEEQGGQEEYLLLILDLGRWENGQRNAPAALYARGKNPTVPIGQEAGWAPEPVWIRRLEKKSSCLCRGSNLDRPVVHSVARHYTD